jgi:hypothetical protein
MVTQAAGLPPESAGRNTRVATLAGMVSQLAPRLASRWQVVATSEAPGPRAERLARAAGCQPHHPASRWRGKGLSTGAMSERTARIVFAVVTALVLVNLLVWFLASRDY